MEGEAHGRFARSVSAGVGEVARPWPYMSHNPKPCLNQNQLHGNPQGAIAILLQQASHPDY